MQYRFQYICFVTHTCDKIHHPGVPGCSNLSENSQPTSSQQNFLRIKPTSSCCLRNIKQHLNPPSHCSSTSLTMFGTSIGIASWSLRLNPSPGVVVGVRSIVSGRQRQQVRHLCDESAAIIVAKNWAVRPPSNLNISKGFHKPQNRMPCGLRMSYLSCFKPHRSKLMMWSWCLGEYKWPCDAFKLIY